MSMDLEKKTYSCLESHFEASANIRVAKSVKTAAESIQAHALVALDESGKLKNIAAPVKGVVAGLYGIVPEAAGADEETVVYLTGEFFADALSLPVGVKAADVEVALRGIGIFLK